MSTGSAYVSRVIFARFARTGSLAGLSLALALNACGGAKGGGGRANGEGGPSGSSSPSPGGSPSPGAAGGTSLAGEWRLVGQYNGGEPTRGTLRLGEAEFSLVVTQGARNVIDISATVDGGTKASVTVTEGGEVTRISGRREGGSETNLGAMPLPLGGEWALAAVDAGDEGPRGCVATLSTDAPSFGCVRTAGVLDWAAPSDPTIEHTETAPSMFGDLGGTWTVSDLGSGGSACVVRFEGNALAVECANLAELAGGLAITFDGDVASGSSRDGLEFSATRN
jgi:hypothetical protein